MGTLADEFTLLLIDPVAGEIGASAWLRGNGGALLMELVLVGRIEVTGSARRAKVVARGAGPTGDALLDAVLRRFGPKPVRAKRAVRRASKHAGDVREALVAAGVLTKKRVTVLGVPWSISFRAVDPRPRAALVAGLSAVLHDGADPDERGACLIGLLSATGTVQKVVGGSKRALRARTKEIEQGGWGDRAASTANQHMREALTSAVCDVIYSDNDTA